MPSRLQTYIARLKDFASGLAICSAFLFGAMDNAEAEEIAEEDKEVAKDFDIADKGTDYGNIGDLDHKAQEVPDVPEKTEDTKSTRLISEFAVNGYGVVDTNEDFEEARSNTFFESEYINFAFFKNYGKGTYLKDRFHSKANSGILEINFPNIVKFGISLEEEVSEFYDIADDQHQMDRTTSVNGWAEVNLFNLANIRITGKSMESKSRNHTYDGSIDTEIFVSEKGGAFEADADIVKDHHLGLYLEFLDARVWFDRDIMSPEADMNLIAEMHYYVGGLFYKGSFMNNKLRANLYIIQELLWDRDDENGTTERYEDTPGYINIVWQPYECVTTLFELEYTGNRYPGAGFGFVFGFDKSKDKHSKILGEKLMELKRTRYGFRSSLNYNQEDIVEDHDWEMLPLKFAYGDNAKILFHMNGILADREKQIGGYSVFASAILPLFNIADKPITLITYTRFVDDRNWHRTMSLEVGGWVKYRDFGLFIGYRQHRYNFPGEKDEREAIAKLFIEF